MLRMDAEKASLIVYYKELEYAREEPQEGEDDTRSVWMARGYWCNVPPPRHTPYA